MGLRRAPIRRFCRDVADLCRLSGNIDGDVQPADVLPELDLRDKNGLWATANASTLPLAPVLCFTG
jgi:hypothetical protein